MLEVYCAFFSFFLGTVDIFLSLETLKMLSTFLSQDQVPEDSFVPPIWPPFRHEKTIYSPSLTVDFLLLFLLRLFGLNFLPK